MSKANDHRQELIQELIESFHVLSRNIGPGREQFLFKVGLNHAQLKFLYFIYSGHELTVQKLVALTKTTPGAITQLVDGLIKKGFLQRIHDEIDKRRIYITLSTSGKKKFERMKRLHIAFLLSLFDVLSEKELRQLAVIQKKLTSKLSAV